LDADSLSLTFLHEGGHVADRIVRGRNRSDATWSALPHSTFAVTDRLTAVSEGFAIHLETLLGHYGADAGARAYYHRLDPQWSPERPLQGAFFAQARDIMTFSQNWARYSAVRDGLAAFEGHVYRGEYLRSQYDPARDRARLKTAGAMVSSEGVVASVLFWIAEGHARSGGARAEGGLDQPGLLDAEVRLLRGLQHAASQPNDRPLDICDVVAAHGSWASQRASPPRGPCGRTGSRCTPAQSRWTCRRRGRSRESSTPFARRSWTTR
jgi:hypothetical protein